MRVRAVLTCLAAAATAAVAAPAAGASPPQPACGQTLTVDTRLRADLTCAGDGLRLGPGVTLDLRGHTLRGSGSGTGLAVASAGTVTVRGGTLTGWGVGMATYAVPDGETGPLVVDRMTFEDSTLGLLAAGESGTGLFGKDATVTRSTFRDDATALLVDAHLEAAVDRSTFADNGVAVEVGDSHVDLTRSRLVRNDVGMSLGQSSTLVDRVTFVDNRLGVVVAPVSGATIARSSFTGSDVAVGGHGNPTVLHVRDNRFTANGTGVLLDLSDGSVTGNTFRANDVGLHVLQAPWDTTLVTDNRFLLGGDGVLVEQGDPLLQLGRNDARRNSRWGIHAPGVTDLGGNTARLNGSDPQCVGVVCS